MNDSQQKYIENLYQEWCEPLTKFFERLDSLGGWPIGFKYATFIHDNTNRRIVYFGNQYLRNGWNTTFCSCDDYYWWKLSDVKKLEIQKLWFKKPVPYIEHYITDTIIEDGL
jgi:hypothetical protein